MVSQHFVDTATAFEQFDRLYFPKNVRSIGTQLTELGDVVQIRFAPDEAPVGGRSLAYILPNIATHMQRAGLNPQVLGSHDYPDALTVNVPKAEISKLNVAFGYALESHVVDILDKALRCAQEITRPLGAQHQEKVLKAAADNAKSSSFVAKRKSYSLAELLAAHEHNTPISKETLIEMALPIVQEQAANKIGRALQTAKQLTRHYGKVRGDATVGHDILRRSLTSVGNSHKCDLS